nr:IS3 family transposase [Nocardia miyunensis]
MDPATARDLLAVHISRNLKFALMEWVDWYNNARLHSRLDYLTPAEYEAAYYSQQPPRRPALV